MLLVALKGLAGCGKSALGHALSRELGWPLIEKDDIKDLLDGHVQAAGPLAYEIMFNLARRQLLQGLNVICDSPLTGSISYGRAQEIAAETLASLVVVECVCSDESRWKERINSRKTLQLPAHHQTDWEAFQLFLRQPYVQEEYAITHPHCIVDTVHSLNECIVHVMQWLRSLDPLVPPKPSGRAN